MYINNIRTFITLFLSVIATVAFSQKKEYNITAVGFYNLENLFYPEHEEGTYDEEFTPNGAKGYTFDIYHKKLENLSRVLSEIATDKLPEGPAVIGVSEVENEKVLQDLIQTPKLKDRKLRIVHFESPDKRGIDVGILYNPRYFKVLGASSHFVDISEGDKKSYTRDILLVTGLLLDDTVHIMVGHWPSRSGGEAASAWKRAKAAQVCRQLTDSLMAINTDAKIIIMGDLNDDPVNVSVTKILGAKGDKHDINKTGLYNPFYSYFKNGQGTLGYRDSWNLFDQIIVSKGLIDGNYKGLQFYKANIFKKSYLLNQFGQYKGYPHRSYGGSTWLDGYSDHLPTYIYVVKEK